MRRRIGRLSGRLSGRWASRNRAIFELMKLYSNLAHAWLRGGIVGAFRIPRDESECTDLGFRSNPAVRIA